MIKVLAGVAGLAAVGLTGCSVYNAPVPYGRVLTIEPHWETVSFFPAENCTAYETGGVELDGTGAIIGAGAGYILSGGLLGTVVGAGAGAYLGGEDTRATNVVCDEPGYAEDRQVISHFNVTYDYNGQVGKGTTMTQYAVGDMMPLTNVNGPVVVRDETVTVPMPREDSGVRVEYINPVMDK